MPGTAYWHKLARRFQKEREARIEREEKHKARGYEEQEKNRALEREKIAATTAREREIEQMRQAGETRRLEASLGTQRGLGELRSRTTLESARIGAEPQLMTAGLKGRELGMLERESRARFGPGGIERRRVGAMEAQASAAGRQAKAAEVSAEARMTEAGYRRALTEAQAQYYQAMGRAAGLEYRDIPGTMERDPYLAVFREGEQIGAYPPQESPMSPAMAAEGRRSATSPAPERPPGARVARNPQGGTQMDWMGRPVYESRKSKAPGKLGAALSADNDDALFDAVKSMSREDMQKVAPLLTPQERERILKFLD